MKSELILLLFIKFWRNFGKFFLQNHRCVETFLLNVSTILPKCKMQTFYSADWARRKTATLSLAFEQLQ